MSRIFIKIGDFLKNSGLAGLSYLLKDISDGSEDVDYGYTEDGQGIWIATEYASKADWTDLYFKSVVRFYEPYSVYAAIVLRIKDTLQRLDSTECEAKSIKDDLKYINEKLLRNSYKSGYMSVKELITNDEPYESLLKEKLRENEDRLVLKERLEEMLEFLKQPVCKETFIMKDALYNFINRFWDGKCFLLRANASKNMREVFEKDFSEPLRGYIKISHEKPKDMCIDCCNRIAATEKVSIAFMKDMADDLARKRSAFWNCRADAFLCPVCAFVYALSPIGFSIYGSRFVFVNINSSMQELLSANEKGDYDAQKAERSENEKYNVWTARTLNMLLKSKTSELGNVQVITRDTDADGRYTFDIINQETLIVLSENAVNKDLKYLSEHPFVKDGDDYINVHETVVLYIIRYRYLYHFINKLLRLAMDNGSVIVSAGHVYDIQLRWSLMKNKSKRGTGGHVMDGYSVRDEQNEEKQCEDKLNREKRFVRSRYSVRDSGYELRNELLRAKGMTDDSCLRGMIYKLLNALSVGDAGRFMDIVMRVYCSTKLQIPNAFIECINNQEKFNEYGYAFLLGLQGSHYEKEVKVNE